MRRRVSEQLGQAWEHREAAERHRREQQRDDSSGSSERPVRTRARGCEGDSPRATRRMIEPHLRRFDWLVLKPVWLGLIGLACALLFQAHWLAGGAMFVLALLGVGAIGASLHRERSFGELAA